MTLAELERLIRARPDGGDRVHLRLTRGRWELRHFPKKGDVPGCVYGATLDELAERAVASGVL